MSKKYGYARCSFAEEKGADLNRQVQKLKAAGAEEIIIECELSNAKEQKKLDMLLETAQPEDIIICCDVSCLSRSSQHFCKIVSIIQTKHMRLEILNSITIDCRSNDIDPISQAFVQMSAVFADLEQSIIRARVKSGMATARIRGKQIGRPHTTKNDIPPIFYKHYPAFLSGSMNVSELAKACGLSRATVYKYLSLLK